MLINLNIGLCCIEANHIQESKNRMTKLKRVKKYSGLYNTNMYNYIEDNCCIDELIKCGFCGSIRKFDNFDYIIKNNCLFIDVQYNDNKFICSRKDNEKTKNCRSKHLNPNSLEMVKICYGFDDDKSANDFLLNRNKSPFYKTNYSTEKEYSKAQKRDAEFYGSEEKYKSVLNKIGYANKKETLIKKYGIEKANKILKSKDSSSKKHFQEKYGNDWEHFFNLKGQKCAGSLKRFINSYGPIIGEMKYNEFAENARINSLNYFNSLTKNDRSRIFGTSSKKYFKEKYGNDWEQRYINHQEKIQSTGFRASKESLIFFEKIVYKIKKHDIIYFIGIDNNKEWFIYDSENNKLNFYDFCIKELNIIIEYHGSIWHYNPSFNYERKLPFNMTIEENRKNDIYKKELAENNGFDYYVVFDTDNKDTKADELSKIILEKLDGKRNV